MGVKTFLFSFTFEMDGIDQHEEHIGWQSRQEVSHLSLGRLLHPLVDLLQALQHSWVRVVKPLGLVHEVLLWLKP